MPQCYRKFPYCPISLPHTGKPFAPGFRTPGPSLASRMVMSQSGPTPPTATAPAASASSSSSSSSAAATPTPKAEAGASPALSTPSQPISAPLASNSCTFVVLFRVIVFTFNVCIKSLSRALFACLEAVSLFTSPLASSAAAMRQQRRRLAMAQRRPHFQRHHNPWSVPLVQYKMCQFSYPTFPRRCKPKMVSRLREEHYDTRTCTSADQEK